MSADHHEGHRSNLFYAGIAVFLGLITFVELGPLFDWYNLPTALLLALSIIKFFFVVAFFMHLWDDDSIFTRVFAAPLVGAVLMVLVLMMLFGTLNPSPKTDSFAIQERYWTNFSGQCYSWVRSSVSNKVYCASGCSNMDMEKGICTPSLDKDRIAMHLPKGEENAGPALKLDSDPAKAKAQLIEHGEKVYAANCTACHQANGQGIPGAFPPLAGSDYEGYKSAEGHIKIVLNGLNGPIKVNGVDYNGAMAAFGTLSDIDVAAVVTYERNAWGNDDGVVMPDQVKAAR